MGKPTKTKPKNDSPKAKIEDAFIQSLLSYLAVPVLFLCVLYFFFFVIYPSGALQGFSMANAKAETRVFQPLELSKLVPFGIRLQHLEELKSEGIVSEADANSLESSILSQAQTLVHDATTEILMKVRPEDMLGGHHGGAFARVRGFMTFTNTIWVLASILLVVSVYNLIKPLLKNLPKVVYEIFVYLLCFVAIAVGALFRSDSGDLGGYVALAGCIGCFAAASFTHKLHYRVEIYEFDKRFPEVFLLLTYAPTAVFYRSNVIGWMAVLALLAVLGFIAGSFMLGYYIGFQRDKDIPKAGIAALMLLSLFTAQKLSPAVASFIPDAIVEPFSGAAMFMGTFVYFLAILILSSQYYHNRSQYKMYLISNMIALLSGILVLYLGNVYGITRLSGVGGTFFMLWALEKYSEIPFGRLWFSFGLLGLSGLLYVMAMFVRTHPEFVFGILG